MRFAVFHFRRSICFLRQIRLATSSCPLVVADCPISTRLSRTEHAISCFVHALTSAQSVKNKISLKCNLDWNAFDIKSWLFHLALIRLTSLTKKKVAMPFKTLSCFLHHFFNIVKNLASILEQHLRSIWYQHLGLSGNSSLYVLLWS